MDAGQEGNDYTGRAVRSNMKALIALAVLTSMVAGVGRELEGMRRGAAFGWTDIAANALGLIAAGMVLRGGK